MPKNDRGKHIAITLSHRPGWQEEGAPFKVGKIVQLLNRNSIAFETIAEIGCGRGTY